jgi:hypothetical protein
VGTQLPFGSRRARWQTAADFLNIQMFAGPEAAAPSLHRFSSHAAEGDCAVIEGRPKIDEYPIGWGCDRKTPESISLAKTSRRTGPC